MFVRGKSCGKERSLALARKLNLLSSFELEEVEVEFSKIHEIMQDAETNCQLQKALALLCLEER